MNTFLTFVFNTNFFILFYMYLTKMTSANDDKSNNINHNMSSLECNTKPSAFSNCMMTHF